MEPNKFENHIKKQLEEREILPSSDAWLKLNDRLDETVIEQPKRKGYFWYAIAACLIGLLVFSVVFFNTTTPTSKSTIQLVEEEKKTIDETDNVQGIEIPINDTEVVATENFTEENVEDDRVKTQVELPEKEKPIEQFAHVSNEVQVPLKEASEEIINTKVLQVLAQIDILEQDNDALTDAEVDSLLRKAQEEILKDKLFRSDNSVDAMALLSEVEGELDKSFRDQIFESLKNGFIKVRTAVADRNN